MKKVMSIDAETNGLWGYPFSIGAILYTEDGKGIDKFCALVDPEKVVTDSWVLENVVPELKSMKVTHNSYEEMLKDFSTWYMQNKKDAEIIWHMGHVVEAFLFRKMFEFGYIGQFDAPYCPVEVSETLRCAGEQPDSVDSYAKKYNLDITDYGTTHNPLYDAEVTAKVYMHLIKQQ